MRPFRVFISFRFSEARREAELLQQALAQRDVRPLACVKVPEGENIMERIVHAIDGCDLAVVMGTSTYGQATGQPFSTYEELEFIADEKKPIFLVKMCDRFEDPKTRFILRKSISHVAWPVGAPMPNNLVDRIIDRLSRKSFCVIERRTDADLQHQLSVGVDC